MKIDRDFNTIPYSEVKRLFNYDAKTGDLMWKIKPCKNMNIGDVVSGNTTKGYKKVSIGKVRYNVHRIVWIWNKGYDSEYFIDHIDKNKMNNRIENLREVTKQCNMRNSLTRKTSKSGVKGVQISSRSSGYFSAQIVVNGKAKHLVFTKDKLEAACHRLAAEQCLSWVDCDNDSSSYNFVKKNIEGIK